jgi:hypothetical protein
MPLSVYSNRNQLLTATNTTKAFRIDTADRELLDSREFFLTLNGDRPNLELHVYTPDGTYLYGNHSALYSIESNASNTLSYEYLLVDVSAELETLGIDRGSYKLIYNLFDNVIGSFVSDALWIKEISPNRRELRLQLTDSTNTTLLNQLREFENRWNIYFQNDIFDSFVLNFGFNETYQIINVKFNITGTKNPEIVVRLYSPLPAKFTEKTKLWISEEIIQPILDTINIVPKYIAEVPNTLAPPNFDLEEFDGISSATTFKSWNDLLTQNTQTSQQLIDTYFSGSLSGVKLNINYRNFENFVHYSSATERVKNFKYKLELIEYYNSRIRTVSTIQSGSIILQNNLTDLYTNRNRVVSGFDDFEKYLFFESTGSRLYTHNDRGSGSIDPWPKTASGSSSLTWVDAYIVWSQAATTWGAGAGESSVYTTFVPTTSEEGIIYYNNLLDIAEIYDKFNIHKLISTIPGHIVESDANEDFLLFVNMLGQHFDILWTYIKNLSTIKTREEHPKDGMPGDFLYHVAESMGFSLLNGRSKSDLWKYALGTNASGSALQETTTGISSISDSDHTKEIWRRIVNNLPYILKTKGSSRAIKALLTCFGIPTTILTIKEYGGPTTFTDLNHYPEYIHDVFHYAWEATTGSNYLFVPTQSYVNNLNPTTIEFRFKTDNNYIYNSGSTYTILSTSGSKLTLTKETRDDNQGTLTYIVNGKSGSISDLEIFDNSWQQVALSMSGSNGAQVQVVKSLYGKTIYNYSSSFVTGSGKYTVQENLYFASGSSKLNGHYQEIRIWSGSLNAATLEEHAASPATYTYNVDRIKNTSGSQALEPYNRLLQRFSLSTKNISSGSGLYYQPTQQPNSSIPGVIYLMNYTNGTVDFEPFEETYYTPSPSLGANTLFSNKIRIESSSLDPNYRLNTQTRIEKSSFDRYSVDSNRLGVYFSPQTAINEDIFNQLGYFEIDDYIGNPGDTYNNYYKDLNTFAINYWKKYNNRNDFEAYFRALQIYDFTLFKYIKKLIPQRVNLISGLVIEPNVLERNKVKLLRNTPEVEDLVTEVTFEKIDVTPSITSEYNLLDVSLNINSGIAVTSEYSYITASIDNIRNINRLGQNWIYNQYVGNTKYKISGSYDLLQTVVLNSRTSEYLLTVDEYFYSSSLSASLGLAYSSSLKKAEINNFYGTGYQNIKFNGSKLSGADINVDSPDTVDGKPVVTVIIVNPNKLVYANNRIQNE